MATAQTPQVQSVSPAEAASAANAEVIHELRIYSHSALFYWWPVWLVGFVMALLTWIGGERVQIGGWEVLFHPSKNVGVCYTITVFLVILISNVSVRGMASVIVILSILFLTVLFAYLGWWEEILRWIPHLALYMNLGFYLFFSTLVFLAWFVSVFLYDRLSYWSIRAGQMTHVFVIGGAERSYDTRGMVFEKIQSDFFRNYILGLGSGDVRIHAAGARNEEFIIPNVLFVSSKLAAMQALIAIRPEEPATQATL